MEESDIKKRPHFSGFIAIIGTPNVGKSTLLNRLIGNKVAIVTPKPQTTRNRIAGILHGDGYQMIFIDTPGIHRTRTPLHRSMVASAESSFQEVDIILLMIEMTRPDNPEIRLVLQILKKTKKKALLIINKIDKGPRENLLPIIDAYRLKYPFEAIVPISALKGDGIETLIHELRSRIKRGPIFFPAHMKTDQSESFLISEIIRESIYFNTRKELPYSTAVHVEKIDKNRSKNLLSISASVYVESQSQKAILIGHTGKMIKHIGTSARLELEKILGTRVFINLTVKVEKNWSKDPRALRRLGY